MYAGVDPGGRAAHSGPMPGWLVAVLLVALLASRPIAARLWRAGRLSDRTATILVLGRFPTVGLITCLATGASPVLTIGLTAFCVLPMAVFYRFFMNLLAEQREERRKEQTFARPP